MGDTVGIIPERIEGETAKAYRAFVDYCEMGTGRSLPKQHREYTERAQEKPPTLHLRTLKRWSTTHGWQARVAEYERRAAEQRTKERIQKQIEIEAEMLEDSARMRDLWARRFVNYEQSPRGVTTYDMRQMFNARGDVDDLYRRSAGLPHRATETTSTLKGTGDRDAILIDDGRAEYHAKALATLADALGGLLAQQGDEQSGALDATEPSAVEGGSESG